MFTFHNEAKMNNDATTFQMFIKWIYLPVHTFTIGLFKSACVTS